MKELYEYKNILIDLFEISENPYFSDEHRNMAQSIYSSIREAEPKTPTHEEIMTKWWDNMGSLWLKVTKYNYEMDLYYAGDVWFNKSWFTGRESADIPPEGNK